MTSMFASLGKAFNMRFSSGTSGDPLEAEVDMSLDELIKKNKKETKAQLQKKKQQEEKASQKKGTKGKGAKGKEGATSPKAGKKTAAKSPRAGLKQKTTGAATKKAIHCATMASGARWISATLSRRLRPPLLPRGPWSTSSGPDVKS